MLYWGHMFLGGTKHFWMGHMRVWKTNLILEDLACQKRTKMWPEWGLLWCLINAWQSEWSVLLWSPWFVSGQIARTLGCCITMTLPVTLPSPWTNFWPKSIFQWFHSPHTRLIWVRVTSFFTQFSNSTSQVVILELWTTSKRSLQASWGHFHMKTSSMTGTRSGSNVSGSVWLPGNYFEGGNVDL